MQKKANVTLEITIRGGASDALNQFPYKNDDQFVAYESDDEKEVYVFLGGHEITESQKRFLDTSSDVVSYFTRDWE